MKKIGLVLIMVAMLGALSGCSSCSRAITDLKSDVNGGMERTVNVYTANGDIIATYQGKIDIEDADGGYVKFDFEGKRYIYYNCFVESIGDISSLD